MINVFLSHSSVDKPFVRELADALEAGGEIKAWLDEREIKLGDNIVSILESGLEADFLLLILSPESVASSWVREERTDALWEQVNTGHSKVIPVLYKDCVIPRLLRNKRYFDLRKSHPEGFRLLRTALLSGRVATPVSGPMTPLPPSVSRASDIVEVYKSLREPGSILALTGIGGVGKSSLAAQYARLHRSEYDAVYLLDCQNGSLAQLAAELTAQIGLSIEGELDEVLREIKAICSRKRTLLVLDNVVDEQVARLLPGGLTSVLVTSRFRALRFLRDIPLKEVQPFTSEQCLNAFRSIIGVRETDDNLSDCSRLCERFGRLPASVSLAANLIRENPRHTIKSMADAPPIDFKALTDAVVGSLPLSSRKLLEAMLVCAPEGFRLALATEIASMDENESLDALQPLYAQSLVEELSRSDRRYRINAFLRETLGRNEAETAVHAETVAKEFTNWEESWEQCERDLADWYVALAWFLKKGVKERYLAEDFARNGFNLTLRRGRLTEALEISEKLLRFGHELNVADTVSHWCGYRAVILMQWRRFDDASRDLKNQEELCVLTEDQEGLQASFGNQAAICMYTHKNSDALAFLKKQEDICVQIDNKYGLLRAYGNQALILKEEGELEKALEFHKKEEALCHEIKDAPGIVVAFRNQAGLLERLGSNAEAFTLYVRQQQVAEAFGDHDGLQGAFGYQASLAGRAGLYDEAMKLYDKQEAVCREQMNLDGVQHSLSDRAYIQRTSKKYDEALESLRKQEAICLESNDRYSLGVCYLNWGLAARGKGDRATGHSRLLESLSIFQEIKRQDKVAIVEAELALD